MATSKTLKGQIGVTTENIFPVIKQFLYSDKEIFLRELVANAVDATQKLKVLASNGEFKGELGEPKVEITLDEKKKVLQVIDHGIGMTEDEVDRYINQIAFSSAGEFLEKYKDQNIIGHFGLGFYSAFMVAKKVTIDTLSWKEGATPVKWSCQGNPEYSMGAGKKADRGTVVTLELDDDAAEYAEKGKIQQLLGKYCKFMPVPVVFGKKTEWKDGKSVETDEDNLINNIDPIWTKAPSELKDEDYLKFYRELYPMEEEPMFWIHLNVDYPFTLTGILYFPKIKERMAIDKNKIQLYCNQMFVTDHVDNIVPDFLTLLHGVIDSPDIPLNVSRSYLQSDANVKKISTYITKKVADRLEEISKEQKEQFEAKWDNLKLFIEYGMLTDEKFCERAMDFALLKNTDGKYFGFEDYRKAIEPVQTDKDKKVVFLYATNTEAQYSFIEAAKNMGYDVLLMDCELDAHFVNLLEQKLKDARFARVDSDSVDNLIPKEDKLKPEMSDEDKKALDELFKAVLPTGNEYQVEAQNLGETGAPVLITRNEFMRRWREMSVLGGGMNFYSQMPESYNILVNMEHPLIARIWESKDKDSDLLHQVVDLALLSNGMLKGKALADFVKRSEQLLK
ncbi:MAG: molecular chaperone HtpG [Bacteroidales bacterium]|nr:molecular chaperone HtpG [Bacteroidales bacterium]MCR5277253.1 molecular chaperone HtpG [Bacteroidales bacterium]